MNVMKTHYEEQLDMLHTKLARTYATNPEDTDAIDALWARIERLQTTAARIEAKEARREKPLGQL